MIQFSTDRFKTQEQIEHDRKVEQPYLAAAKFCLDLGGHKLNVSRQCVRCGLSERYILMNGGRVSLPSY